MVMISNHDITIHLESKEADTLLAVLDKQSGLLGEENHLVNRLKDSIRRHLNWPTEENDKEKIF